MSTDPVAAVRQYLDGFYKGDAKVMAASFADTGSILDGMAPHLWQGPTAAQDWCCVYPATMTFKAGGRHARI